MSAWPSTSPHPIVALAMWRAIDTHDVHATAPTRAIASGGGLARVLVATRLVTVDELAACVVAQCEAPEPNEQLRFVIESDVFCIAAHADRAMLARVSDAIAGTWLDACSAADSLHTALLARCIASGDDVELLRVLPRVRWHTPLLRLLATPGPVPGGVEPIARGVAERVQRLLPRDYLAGALADLAIATRDDAWLTRARDELRDFEATLVRAQADVAWTLATNPDREHPAISIARAEATLGHLDAALARVRALDDDERWPGLVALASLGNFSLLRSELLALRAKLEVPWHFALDGVAELTPDAVAAIAREPAHEQVHAWFAVAPYVTADVTRDVCARGVASLDAFGPDVDLDASGDAWLLALDRLDRCNMRELLAADLRARLYAAWRARDDAWADDLADVIAPFVPDDCVNEAIEYAQRRLLDAATWTERGTWLACGMRMHERASSALRDRWLDAAANALAQMPADQIDDDALAPFTLERRREIVLRALEAVRTRGPWVGRASAPGK